MAVVLLRYSSIPTQPAISFNPSPSFGRPFYLAVFLPISVFHISPNSLPINEQIHSLLHAALLSETAIACLVFV